MIRKIKFIFKNIKIQVRMMLWYTLLTVAFLAVFLPVLYHIISVALYHGEENKLLSAMTMTEVTIEFDHVPIDMSEELRLPSTISLLVWQEHQPPLYTWQYHDWLGLDTAAFVPGTPFQIWHAGSDYLLFDSYVVKNDIRVNLRLGISLEEMEYTKQQILLLMLVSIPLFLLITIIGGLLIAGQALQPIRKIIHLAHEIEQGALSRRITGIKSADEVGELADTFNKMLDSLQQSFEKEQRFTSDASHELRTPVAVITACSEAILALNPDQEIHALSDTVLTESHRMKKIISQLLMFTKGMEGKYLLKPEDVSIYEIANAVLDLLQEEAAKKSITLHNDSADFCLLADQSLMTQMILNLAENAIKYGRPGGHVRIHTEKQDNTCLITVSDDGIGILPEELPFIFDRFYRVDKSRDRSGSGLGLSIVKWIAEMHGGKIDVRSTVNQGTVFLIYLSCLPSAPITAGTCLISPF